MGGQLKREAETRIPAVRGEPSGASDLQRGLRAGAKSERAASNWARCRLSGRPQAGHAQGPDSNPSTKMQDTQ